MVAVLCYSWASCWWCAVAKRGLRAVAPPPPNQYRATRRRNFDYNLGVFDAKLVSSNARVLSASSVADVTSKIRFAIDDHGFGRVRLCLLCILCLFVALPCNATGFCWRCFGGKTHYSKRQRFLITQLLSQSITMIYRQAQIERQDAARSHLVVSWSASPASAAIRWREQRLVSSAGNSGPRAWHGALSPEFGRFRSNFRAVRKPRWGAEAIQR